MSRPYAFLSCNGLDDEFKPCGTVSISKEEYERQMDNPYARWRCPKCGAEAEFEDEESEAAMMAYEIGTVVDQIDKDYEDTGVDAIVLTKQRWKELRSLLNINPIAG